MYLSDENERLYFEAMSDAARLLAAEGLGGTSALALARALRVSVGGLYRGYTSKEDAARFVLRYADSLVARELSFELSLYMQDSPVCFARLFLASWSAALRVAQDAPALFTYSQLLCHLTHAPAPPLDAADGVDVDEATGVPEEPDGPDARDTDEAPSTAVPTCPRTSPLQEAFESLLRDAALEGQVRPLPLHALTSLVVGALLQTARDVVMGSLEARVSAERVGLEVWDLIRAPDTVEARRALPHDEDGVVERSAAALGPRLAPRGRERP